MTAQTLRASAPTPFYFQALTVRVTVIDDTPWFVADDVAKALDYPQAKDLTRSLDDDEKGGQIVPTLGGPQEMTIINESGLYSAILKSRKPEAKRFKKWVTSELLPAIRRHGGYQVPNCLPNILSGEQHAQLVCSAQSIAASFWFKDIAKRALFDRLRSAFGVDRLEHIPANGFERALEILAEVEIAVRRYARARYKQEMHLIGDSIRPRRNAVRRGQPTGGR